MQFIKEFREFAMKGNMVDLAIGVIIGAAFGKVVSSLVADILMPVLGLLIGGIDFKQFSFILKAAQGNTPAVLLNYGMFIETLVNFLIVAFAIFVCVKMMNKLRNTTPTSPSPTPPKASDEVALLTEIRDLMQKGS